MITNVESSGVFYLPPAVAVDRSYGTSRRIAGMLIAM